jgi:hypothetical protein
VELPFLLTGPIVRRVEPRLVSVWVVTREPATVRLRVWFGPMSAGTGTGGPVFAAPGTVAEGQRSTVRVGAKAHVAVVTATPAPNEQSLLPGARYSYNVDFDGSRDLRTLGLLENRPTQPALGYQAGLLPSFATCPATLDELVVLHGSCNRIHAKGGPNLFYAVDELVEQNLDEPRHRPHQLWLTGDQVYADEVPAPLSSRITALGRELLGADERFRVEIKENSTTRELFVKFNQRHVPAAYRQKLMTDVARLTAGEAESHLLGVTERLAMQLLLWSPDVWERDETGKVLLDEPEALLPTKEPPLAQAPAGEIKDWLAKNLEVFESDRKLAHERAKAAEQVGMVQAYSERIGRIRRALASVATYMVFDDHDVTDDWNVCQLWKEHVHGSDLGRSVIRDGLVVFALTQGWGNDPLAYEAGAGADLLARISDLFPPGAAEGPGRSAADAIDTILGLAAQPPQMRWNFSVDGPAHRVIACDTRTRRGFSGPVSPPILLPEDELATQIPEGPLEAGIEMLMVVLSQPGLDPTLLGELTQGLIARGATAGASISKKMDDPRDAAITGLETLDYEGWSARPAELARLLDRLATYPRVMILSGDVHFAVTLELRFWRHGQGLVSTIGQFTSSALQYITHPEVLVPLLGQGWANELMNRGYPVKLLVWRDPVDAPIATPTLARRSLRRRMRQRPVLLPTRGWPDGAAEVIPRDFAWRIDLLRDVRADGERPESARAEPLTQEFDAADALHGANGYGALARRHQSAARKHTHTRSIGLFNKIARLTFAHRELDGRLVARSELLSIDHHAPFTAATDAFTLHELVFDEPDETPEPMIEP